MCSSDLHSFPVVDQDFVWYSSAVHDVNGSYYWYPEGQSQAEDASTMASVSRVGLFVEMEGSHQ